MVYKIYYTVDYECYPDSNERNGNITIRGYKAFGKDDLKICFELNSTIESPYTYTEEIQEWLDDDGDIIDYDLIRIL